jgi:hypothetical protein
VSNYLRLPGKFGRKPADLSRPHLRLTAHLRPEAVSLPPNPVVVDWLSLVAEWPMFLNDQLGCCTCAMIAHACEAYSTYGQGVEDSITDNDVLTAYEAVGGYVPGDPSTDGGAVIQDVLSYWRRTGIGGHKIAAFARVDHTNLDEVRAAVNVFGALLIGVNLPAIAQEQFANGQPWDVVAYDGGIEGGHAVHGGAYDENTKTFTVTTWGQTQKVTEAWWLHYVEECWVAISPEWLSAAGLSPEGIDLYGLGEDLARITGKPNPFPRPNPEPIPGPAPTPTPVPPGPPVVDPDQALAAAARTWLTAGPHHSRADRHLAGELHAWLAETSL